MTRQPRPSRVYLALPCSGPRLAVTAPRAWPPHNCPHSPWRGAHMGPGGQVSCTAGCGWGFEADADLIPAHSPMLSRTRMIPPIPIHRFLGFRAARVAAGVAQVGRRGPRPRAGRRARSQSAGPRPQVLPCPERYTVHCGLGDANIAGPWCSSPSSDLRITSVYGPLVSGLASV